MGRRLQALAHIGARYWVTAALVLVACLLLSARIEHWQPFEHARDRLFQQLVELAPRPLEPRYVKVVLVGDEEYWRGPLAGRAPIKRDYLAQLVRRLDAAEASTIALDFDLRTEDPDRATTAPDYAAETAALVRTLVDAAQRRRIVLGRTLWTEPGDGERYRLEADAYSSWGICTGKDARGGWLNPGTAQLPIDARAAANIACGYVALPFDARRIPGELALSDGSHIESFALAVARSRTPGAGALLGREARFGSFIPPQDFDADVVLDAALVRAGDERSLQRLQGQIVVVGGAWHTLAYDRGALIDEHHTPVGRMSGALIHANFVEALLDARLFGHTPEWVVKAAEILVSVLAAILFALFPGLLFKLAALAAVTVGFVALQWTLLHALGVTFDALVPIAGVWLHSVIERLIGAH